MSSWHSYPKVYGLGHRALTGLFDGPTIVQEKVDGSQFSFGWIDGELKIRSKGQDIFPGAVPAMFQGAVDTVISLQERDLLHDGWTYRGEVLSKPRHNVLAYDRVPAGNVILFDINDAEESYLGHATVTAEAVLLGLESVPTFAQFAPGQVPPTRADFDGWMERVSVLGGNKIEGVVIKNYTQWGPDKKVIMGKFVSEAFKEVQGGGFRKANPTTNDQVQALIARYRTPARWNKAVQHLSERDALDGSPKDIGPLLKELHDDLQAECADEIKELLFKHFWPKVARGIQSGFPEFYKLSLVDKQFEQ